MIYQDERTREWVIFTDGIKTRFQNKRSMQMADKFMGTLASIKAGTRVMFDAQQNECFANIRLMVARGDITITPVAPVTPDAPVTFTVTINKTDEQLAQLGLDRAEEEGGLAALYRTLTSVSDADSHAITVFMD